MKATTAAMEATAATMAATAATNGDDAANHSGGRGANLRQCARRR